MGKDLTQKLVRRIGVIGWTPLYDSTTAIILQGMISYQQNLRFETCSHLVAIVESSKTDFPYKAEFFGSSGLAQFRDFTSQSVCLGNEGRHYVKRAFEHHVVKDE